MFYEGTEKKLEVVVNAGQDLRQLGRAFWQAVVAQANALIVSTIKNDQCDAYVLSESSLFVWHNKFVMLTCGETTLADAFILFAEQFGHEKIAFMTYQRGRELCPSLQVSHFIEDANKLAKVIPGCAYRIGMNENCHYVFHTSAPHNADDFDSTSELLMYQISGSLAKYLCTAQQDISVIRQMLNLQQLLPEFVFDDFLFTPQGYSINGLCENKYFTLHITPQPGSSYVGCETNLNLETHPVDIFGQLLALFEPLSWDTIGFNSKICTTTLTKNSTANACVLSIEQGYDIDFQFFQQDTKQILVAERL